MENIVYSTTLMKRNHPVCEKQNICYCSGQYTSVHWSQHRKTKKHLKFLESLKPEQFYQIFRYSNLI